MYFPFGLATALPGIHRKESPPQRGNGCTEVFTVSQFAIANVGNDP